MQFDVSFLGASVNLPSFLPKITTRLLEGSGLQLLIADSMKKFRPYMELRGAERI